MKCLIVVAWSVAVAVEVTNLTMCQTQGPRQDCIRIKYVPLVLWTSQLHFDFTSY